MLARQEAARRVGYRGRQDPANLMVIIAVAVMFMLVALGGVVLARAAGVFEPQLITEVDDPRRLTNLRNDLRRNPIVDSVWHGPDQSLYVLKRGNLVQRYHQPTGLWHDEPLGGAEQGVAGQVIYLQSGCGDDPRLAPGESDCEDTETLWALTDSGGLLRRTGGTWKVLAGGSAFVGADGRAVSNEQITAVARAVDGEMLLFGAGEQGLGLYHITGRRWLPLPAEQHKEIAQAAVREIKAVGDGFAIATGNGLYAFARPGTNRAEIKAHETVTGAVRLMVTDRDGGLIVLEDVPCETGAGLISCQRLSRLETPLGAPNVLIHEKSRSTALQMSDLTGVFWLDDHLILTGPAGVHAYNETTHSFTEIESGRVLTARMRTRGFGRSDELYYGVAGSVGRITRVSQKPDLWGVGNGGRVTQIQFTRDSGAQDQSGDVLALTAEGGVYELGADNYVDEQLAPDGVSGSAKGLQAVARFGDWLLFVSPGDQGGRIYRHNVVTRKWVPVGKNAPKELTNPDARFVLHPTAPNRDRSNSITQSGGRRGYTGMLYVLVGGASTQGVAIDLKECLQDGFCEAPDHLLNPVEGDLRKAWPWKDSVAVLTSRGGLHVWQRGGGMGRNALGQNIRAFNPVDLIGAPPPGLAKADIRDASLHDDKVVLATDLGVYEYSLGASRNTWRQINTAGLKGFVSATALGAADKHVGLLETGELYDTDSGLVFGSAAAEVSAPDIGSVRQVLGDARFHYVNTGKDIHIYDVSKRRWVRQVSSDARGELSLIGGMANVPVYLAGGKLKRGSSDVFTDIVRDPILSGQTEHPALRVSGGAQSLLALERVSGGARYLSLHDWARTLQDRPKLCLGKRPFAGSQVRRFIDVAPLNDTVTAVLHNAGLSIYDAETGNWTSLIQTGRVSETARLLVTSRSLVWVDRGRMYRIARRGSDRSGNPFNTARLTSEAHWSCASRIANLTVQEDSQIAAMVSQNVLYWIGADGALYDDSNPDAFANAPGRPTQDFAPGRLRRLHRMENWFWAETPQGLSGYDFASRTWRALTVQPRWPSAVDGQQGSSIIAGQPERPTVLATGRGKPYIGEVQGDTDRLSLGPLDLPGAPRGWRLPVTTVTDSIQWQDQWAIAFETGLKLYNPDTARWTEFGPLPRDPRRELKLLGNSLVVLESSATAWLATAARNLRGGSRLSPGFTQQNANELLARGSVLVAPNNARFGRYNGVTITGPRNGTYIQQGNQVALCPTGREISDRGCTRIWPAPLESFVRRPRTHWVGKHILLLSDRQNAAAVDRTSRQALPETPAIVAPRPIKSVGEQEDGTLLVLMEDGRAWMVTRTAGWEQLKHPQPTGKFAEISIDDLGVLSLQDEQGTLFRLSAVGGILQRVGPGQLPAFDPQRRINPVQTSYGSVGGIPDNLPVEQVTGLEEQAGQLTLRFSNGDRLRLGAFPAQSNSLREEPLVIGRLRGDSTGQRLLVPGGQQPPVPLMDILNGGRFFNQDQAVLTLHDGNTVAQAMGGHVWHLPLDKADWSVGWPDTAYRRDRVGLRAGAPGGFETETGQFLSSTGRFTPRPAWPRRSFGQRGNPANPEYIGQPADLLLNGQSMVAAGGWKFDQRLGLERDAGGNIQVLTNAGREQFDHIGLPLSEPETLRLTPVIDLRAALSASIQPVESRRISAQLQWRRSGDGFQVRDPQGRELRLVTGRNGPGFARDQISTYAVLTDPDQSGGQFRQVITATPAGLVEHRFDANNLLSGPRRILAAGDFSRAEALVSFDDNRDRRLFVKQQDGQVRMLQAGTLAELGRTPDPFRFRYLTDLAEGMPIDIAFASPLHWVSQDGRIRAQVTWNDSSGGKVTRPARLGRSGYGSDRFTAMARIGSVLWLGSALGVERHSLDNRNNLGDLSRSAGEGYRGWLLGEIKSIEQIRNGGDVRVKGPGGCWMFGQQATDPLSPRLCSAEERRAPAILSIPGTVGGRFWQWRRSVDGKVEFDYLNATGRVSAGPYTLDGKPFPHDRITAMADCEEQADLRLAEVGILTLEQRGGRRNTEFISQPDGVNLACLPSVRPGADPARTRPHILRGPLVVDLDGTGKLRQVPQLLVPQVQEKLQHSFDWGTLRLAKTTEIEPPRFEALRDGKWVAVDWKASRLTLDHNLGVLSSGLRAWMMTPIGFVPYTYKRDSTDLATPGRNLSIDWSNRGRQIQKLPDACSASAPLDVLAVPVGDKVSGLELSCGGQRWRATLGKDAASVTLEELAPEEGTEANKQIVLQQDDGWTVTRSRGVEDISFSIARWDRPVRLSQGRFGFDQLRSLTPSASGWDIATGAAGWMQVNGQSFALSNWSPPTEAGLDPTTVLRLTAGADEGVLCFDVEGGRSIELASNGEQAQRAQCLEVLAQDGLWVYRRNDAAQILIEAEPRGGGVARRDLEAGRFSDDIAIGFAAAIDGSDGADLVMPVQAGLLRLGSDGEPLGLSIPDFEGLRRGEVPKAIMAAPDGDSVIWASGNGLAGEAGGGIEMSLRQALPRGGELIALGQGPDGQIHLRWRYQNLIGTSTAAGEGATSLSSATLDLTQWPDFIARRESWGDPPAAMDIVVGQTALGIRLPGQQGQSLIAGTTEKEVLTTAISGERLYLIEPDNLHVLDLSQLMESRFEQAYGQ
ncbi:MAG: hypothetical protein Alpg2KO_07120 [Alphaproteobacteria bacterium]